MKISSDKIDVNPTKVNPKAFAYWNPSEICSKYHLGSKKVAEYKGSPENYQGIEYLIRAMSLVFRQLEDKILLVVGDG